MKVNKSSCYITMEHRLTAPAIKAHLLLLFVELHFASIDFGVERGDGSAIAFDLPAALKLKLAKLV